MAFQLQILIAKQIFTVKVSDTNSFITGFPTRTSLSLSLYRDLLWKSMGRGLYDRDIGHKRGNTKLRTWTNPVQCTIFKNVFRDSDIFVLTPLAAFAAINHEHFGIFLYLIFEKRSATIQQTSTNNVVEAQTLLLFTLFGNGLKTSFVKQVRQWNLIFSALQCWPISLLASSASTRNATENTPQSKEFSCCCTEQTLISKSDSVVLAKSQICFIATSCTFPLSFLSFCRVIFQWITVVKLKL